MTTPSVQQRFDAAKRDKDVEAYRGLCRQALSAAPAFVDEPLVVREAMAEAVCHLCGMAIGNADACASPFIQPTPADDEIPSTGPVHRACRDLRVGASGDETWLSLKMGLWAITRIRKQGGRHLKTERPHQQWLPGLLAAWTDSVDPTSTRLLPGLPAHDLGVVAPLNSADGIVLLTRVCYVDERERGKSEQLSQYGAELRPDWDRTESWRSWEDRHDAWYCAPATKSARELAKQERSRHRLTTKGKSLAQARTRGHCHFCGSAISARLQLDHIVPFARGGSSDPRNFLAAHGWCNGTKEQKGPTELSLSLLVGRWLLAGLARPGDLPQWLNNAAKRFVS